MVRIKHNGKPTEIKSFDNEEELRSLMSALTGDNKKRFESDCEKRLEIKGGTEQKSELDVEKTNTGSWDVYEPTEE